MHTIKTILKIPGTKFQVVCRQTAMLERVWASWEVDTILVAETLGAMVMGEVDSIAVVINQEGFQKALYNAIQQQDSV